MYAHHLVRGRCHFCLPALVDGLKPRSGPHLTRRDQFANTLEDMFDFENAPSLNTVVGAAALPLDDCGPF
jgi:hypothetical protein